MLDIAGLVLGAALTLMILSYLLGDNPLYRLALHLFLGAVLGYSFGILLRDVFILTLLAQLVDRQVAVAVPLVLGLLLAFKTLPKQNHLGNISLAYLVGVGTAVALSGALLGTIVPQIGATGHALAPQSLASFPLATVDGLLIIVGTVSTLTAFAFTTRNRQGVGGVWIKITGLVTGVGRTFLIFAFGVAFAGALTAALSIFIGRIQYLSDVYFQLTAFLGP